MSLCFICESSLEDGTLVSNVKSRGIASLIKASTERKDGKGFTAAQARLPPSERNTVYSVRHMGVKTTVMNAAGAPNDDYGWAIIQRIRPVNNLIAADAQYHSECFKDVYGRPKVQEQQKRGPFAEEIDRFSMEELMKQISRSYQPDVKTARARLIEKYEEMHRVIERGFEWLKQQQKLFAKLLNYKYMRPKSIVHQTVFWNSYQEAVRFEISSAMKPEIEINREGFCQFIYNNVAPETAVPADEKISILTEIPTSAVVGSFGAVTLKHFEPTESGQGLKTTKIQDFINEFSTSKNVSPCTQVTADISLKKSFTAYLPFITAPPTYYDTIFTALLQAAEKCKAKGQKMCMVTFDQPRYLKARYIISNYTDSSQAVFTKIVMEIIGLTSETQAKLDEILYNLDKSVILASAPDECREIREKYIRLVTLVKIFILSEIMGNWDQHLQTVWQMLPYFQVPGHFAYAKRAHLYLQDMLNLKQTMPAEEYEKFTIQDFFTIRRSTKFWCGTWTDMTIEQYLMKNTRLQGGLTHGRGVGEGLKDSTVVRDNKDDTKMYEWLLQYFLFPENPDLYSISIGIDGINRVVGGDFGTVKFKRSDRVKHLAVMICVIRVDDELIPINPTTLFQRISAAVVFGGYPDDVQGGRKTAESMRRSRKHASTDILFDDTMILTMSKEKFLLTQKTRVAKEDADTLIVNTALSLAPSNEMVIVVGEDVELLDTVSPATFSLTIAVSSTVAENIIFLHAMTSYDTMSALFMQGKMKFLKTLVKNPHVADVKVFKHSNATQEMVAATGKCFLVSLYGYSGTNVPLLNHLRYISYKKSAFRYSSNIAALPPSANAARQHSLRVYHQKAGLCCSNMCLNCEGNCNNIVVVSQDEDDELDLETKLEMDCPPIEPVDPMEEEQAMPQVRSTPEYMQQAKTNLFLTWTIKHFFGCYCGPKRLRHELVCGSHHDKDETGHEDKASAEPLKESITKKLKNGS
ncbi:hypothetical protein PR048_016900 [Dryococelus australis]|uniref:Uncharacterized protein n=1 Tax=Dryococelus australis TaxID=614101 RepID=A0ABQ9H862_9NEOP|nr:hypothetical protein PR048_016900 [Dryococelus australis]